LHYTVSAYSANVEGSLLVLGEHGRSASAVNTSMNWIISASKAWKPHPFPWDARQMIMVSIGGA